jgi:heme-degrading monooxygenase HmoA
MPDDRTAAHGSRAGQIAVIYAAWRTRVNEAGYAEAARAMDALAAAQPGCLGVDAARGGDGFGITVRYWTDEVSAMVWRDHPQRAAMREAGRGSWYDHYDLHIAHVTRSYSWRRAGKERA